MNAATRQRYFALWQQLCRARGYDPRDEAARREITLYVADACGFASTGSTRHLDAHQVTALLTYLRHAVAPRDAKNARLWERCQADYVAFNLVNQGEHYRRQSGERAGGRINRHRFKIHFAEELEEHALSPREARNYVITHARRARRARSKATAETNPF